MNMKSPLMILCLCLGLFAVTANALRINIRSSPASEEVEEPVLLQEPDIQKPSSNNDTARESRSIGYGLTPLGSSSSSVRPVVNILNEHFNAPGTIGENDFDFSFESENGIRQETVGVTKTIGDETVVVMKGSYSYVGPDGQNYVVDWYADETGYHPSAPHLPREVSIPYPEIADAVDSQITFAAEEEAKGIFYDEPTGFSSEKSIGYGSKDNYIF
ncbi:endocuticle structural glycoprotein ABD-4 [Lepeophtheirus salmonis]|uniref:endocuticle structural glycoprotein ABD-4 n=1 Tax=Lepeophtheirus salmonis TaxID=72036 RepID=UPI001AEA9114|nr:endocuticle structural glycoprotein ABD-4-like [Lepeophtheirus salmonis]